METEDITEHQALIKRLDRMEQKLDGIVEFIQQFSQAVDGLMNGNDPLLRMLTGGKKK